MAGEDTGGRRVSDIELAKISTDVKHIKDSVKEMSTTMQTMVGKLHEIDREQAERGGKQEAMRVQIEANKADIDRAKSAVWKAVSWMGGIVVASVTAAATWIKSPPG